MSKRIVDFVFFCLEKVEKVVKVVEMQTPVVIAAITKMANWVKENWPVIRGSIETLVMVFRQLPISI